VTGRRRARRPRDTGSASIWVLACAVLVLVVAALAAIRGLAVLARHRAESAADLAALAAAGRIGISADYCARAAAVARRNGAAVTSCSPDLSADGRTGSVVVTVHLNVDLPLVGGRTVAATARAGRMPAPSPVHDGAGSG
jgi:secretion/DNA translocation related TadE-like protein